MERPSCKCLRPEGGGTTCPAQHIALCIRGKDRECYGECIPIPNKYRIVSNRFTGWMSDELDGKVTEYVSNNLPERGYNKPIYLERVSADRTDDGGTITFSSDLGTIYVRYSFAFNNDRPDYGGSQSVSTLTR